MGDSGLRCEEAAHTLRQALKVSCHSQRLDATYKLKVFGKQRRKRAVPFSPDTIATLNVQWADRGLDCESIQDKSTHLFLAVGYTAH
jgi:hypothetical protein